MADSSSINPGLFSATIRSKLKILLCTNLKVMLSLLFISLTFSTLLQLNSSSLMTSFIFESFIIPYPANTYGAYSHFDNIDFTISNYDIKAILNVMIFVSITYTLSYLITVVIIHSLHAIYMKEDLRLKELISGALRSWPASFSTKLYITVTELAFNVCTLPLLSLIFSWSSDSQLSIMCLLLVAMLSVCYLLHFYVRSVLVVSLIASVTEKSCGLSALRSAMKIVKGRKKHAWGFSFECNVYLTSIFYVVRNTAIYMSKALVTQVVTKAVSVIVYAMLGVLLVAVYMAIYYELKEKSEEKKSGIKEDEYTSLTDGSFVKHATSAMD